jgi:hypothetical protein
VKRVTLSILVAFGFVLSLATSASAGANPVLGAKAFAAPYGKGFGTAEPSEIFNGGYYRRPARIELRAADLGKCGKQAAYTKLEFRAPKKPGGKLGKWMSWSGTKTICKSPF